MNESSQFTETSYYIIPIALLVLLCLSFFFSSCEMSFSTLNRIKLKNLAVKNKRARLVLKMLEVFDKILSTVLIGNNIVNIAASALAAALFISLFGQSGVSLATLIMTILVLVFGDITPKALAKESPEMTALRNAPLLNFFVFVFSPINLLMTGWKMLLMKIFPKKDDRSVTEDELLTYVEEVRQEGGINIQEEKMIRHAIEFDDLKVSGIFTPRVDVAAVSITSSAEEIDKIFIDTGFSRLPVYEDTIDNIKGIIVLKDFYHEVMKNIKTPAMIVKPVVFVTKTIKIPKLLKTLQEKHAQMAVIVDEHGGTLGIATIEDIIEVLVGEIWDEHDKVVELVKKNTSGGFTVLGNVIFKEMLKALEKQYDSDDIPDTTAANWIMENLGRLPKHGETLTWNDLTIKVLRINKQRAMELSVIINK